MKLNAVAMGCILLNVACSAACSGSSPKNGQGAQAGAGGSSGGTGNASGGMPTAGSGASMGTAGKPPIGPLTPAMGTPGVWEEVTSPDMDPALFTGSSTYGVGNIVTDPARPTDMYVGGYGSIWKSTDYGLTWKEIPSNPKPPSLALGHVLAVAGTEPATLWMASLNGAEHVYRSRDAGLTFTLTGAVPEQPDAASLYSIEVDPNDPTHLITGLHEQDGVLESTDAGDTWKFVSKTGGFPSGGKSWFPYFVNAGDAGKTRLTWFAIAQDGGSAVMTSDGGKTWKIPSGLDGLQHPHGSAGFFQHEQSIFVAGVRGPEGDGVYRSTDGGGTWARVVQGSGGVAWGTPKNVYAMWGWACGGCGLDEGGPEYQTAPMPGTEWTKPTLPERLVWGPNSVAVTSDGKRHIMVGSMWATGLWRYVEP
jgi:photosystem II stability/assembly factor-like uncharacterized protein